jgi:hypothetical protein
MRVSTDYQDLAQQINSPRGLGVSREDIFTDKDTALKPMAAPLLRSTVAPIRFPSEESRR